MPPPRNTTHDLVRHLARGNIPPAEIPQVLTAIFNAGDYKSSLKHLHEPDLRMWVESLDQIIGSRICDEMLRRRTLRSLRKTCGLKRILPKSHYFRGRLFRTSNRPATSTGGTADVWRVTDERKQFFAAKIFRVNDGGEERKIKRYYKELTIWKQLNHPNVIQTFGASTDIAEFCVVAPWMTGGDLLQYLKTDPGANRVGIMFGVSDGLHYLHYNDVIHGDMKGANILFDHTGVPRLSDFGLSSITIDSYSANASTPYPGISVRWAAPEILEAPDEMSARPTKMSDIYAFAMVVVEIFTGKVPFPDLADMQVRLAIAKGKRPSKPTDASRLGLSSKMWKLVEDCWYKRKEKRPDIQYVAHRLRELW